MNDHAELIARVEAALDGVTPGPWEADIDGESIAYADIYEASGRKAFHVGSVTSIPTGEHEANARFIAAARQDVPDLLAALKAVMAERDVMQASGSWYQEKDIDAMQAEAAALRARVAEVEGARLDAMARRRIHAPEDQHIEVLCNRYGYGAVMDAASRLWARKDSMGAFYIGGCIGLRDDAEAAALRAKAKP